MTTFASYVPGDWVAVSAPGTWLLVALPPDHPIVQRCWDMMMSPAPAAEDILDALVSEGIRAAPHFAFACATDQRRVLARGGATITVTDSVGAVELKVSADAGAVWAEDDFTEEVDLLLLANGAAPASDIELPMASGVTMASRIRIRMRVPEPITSTQSAGPSPAGAPMPAVADGTGVSALEPLPTGQAPSRTESHAHSDAGQEPSEPEPDAGTDDEKPTQPVPSPGPASSYDFLFGATQRPLQPDDVIAEVEGSTPDELVTPTAVPADPALTAGWFTVTPPEFGSLDPAAAAAARPASPPIIDAVPWHTAEVTGAAAATPAASGPEPSAAARSQAQRISVPVSSPASGPEHAQLPDIAQTVDRAAITAASEPLPSGPTVLAGHCPLGHLSPPYAASCRVCRAPMPADQHGFDIARPPLGVIRLADGGMVALDRGVLLGRAPQPPGELAELPHLVRLVSPQNDISRNHAHIVLDGWNVYVQDLGSTNGTVVTLPGRAPVRLRPDDLQLLEDGSSITLADEVTVTFEVTA